MSGTDVRVEIGDGAAWITLDGPQTRNALDAAAAARLIDACEQVDADPRVGVAVITGSGGAFCSGADTAVLDRLRTAPPDQAYDGLGSLYAAFLRVGRLAVPSVAVVDGPAVGAGVNLALAADLRLVSETARFVSGFSRVGLHPGGGHLHLLARAGGAGLAASAGVFALPVGAHDAVAAGLAARCVPAAELADLVAGLTAHLRADPALARALAGSLRRTVLDAAGWDRAVEVERARQLWSLSRHDTQEA